jgi:hypothetical protein
MSFQGSCKADWVHGQLPKRYNMRSGSRARDVLPRLPTPTATRYIYMARHLCERSVD